MPIPRRLVLVLLFAAAQLASSQTPPGFEVASIKRSSPDSLTTIGPQLKNGRLTGSVLTLHRILSAAFGLSIPRIIGPAVTLNGERFDLSAKAPEGAPDTEMKPMLQALLRERFRLEYHRETRLTSAYELVQVKGGTKLAPYPAPAPPIPDYGTGAATMRGLFEMPHFVEVLSAMAERPVVDKTGLSERYNLWLNFSLATGRPRQSGENAPPELFTALQEQLGLKLEPKKIEIEVVVIDHIDKLPSEN